MPTPSQLGCGMARRRVRSALFLSGERSPGIRANLRLYLYTSTATLMRHVDTREWLIC